jgi:hypothetical protein
MGEGQRHATLQGAGTKIEGTELSIVFYFNKVTVPEITVDQLTGVICHKDWRMADELMNPGFSLLFGFIKNITAK